MSDHDNQPGPDESAGTFKKSPRHALSDLFFSAIAIVALAIWEPTKWLWLNTYTETSLQNRDCGCLNWQWRNVAIGAAVSLLTSLGVGYNAGWLGGAAWYQWLAAGGGAAILSFLYGWPLFYQVVCRYAFSVSARLWSHVNIDACVMRWGRNPVWFSLFLLQATQVVILLTGLYLAYYLACFVQAHQSGWDWLGVLLGFGLMPLAVVAIGGIFLAIAASADIITAVLVFLVAGAVAWWFSIPTFALLTGLYNNLTGADWGVWGYVPGAVAGATVGGISIWAANVLLRRYRLRLVATLFGVAAACAVGEWTSALVAPGTVGAYSFQELALLWFAYCAELLFFIGFAFPAAHIGITHGLKNLPGIRELMTAAYKESPGYREFFWQVVAIIAAVVVAIHGPALITACVGWNSLWALTAGTALLSVSTYVGGYSLLSRAGSRLVGAGAATYVSKAVLLMYLAHGWPFGIAGAILASVQAFVGTYMVAFPLLYACLHWAIPAALVNRLRSPLMLLHRRITSVVSRIGANLFGAFDSAYKDNTLFRETALHVLNILTALAVLGGTLYVSVAIGVAVWLSVLFAALSAAMAYVLLGQVFLYIGLAPVSLTISWCLGIYFGTIVYGSLHIDWLAGRCMLSALGGLAGAVLSFGALLPWLYVSARKLARRYDANKWLRPLLMSTHGRGWQLALAFWRNFQAKYQLLHVRLAGARQDFKVRYAALRKRLEKLYRR